jgi:hypothetical protein
LHPNLRSMVRNGAAVQSIKAKPLTSTQTKPIRKCASSLYSAPNVHRDKGIVLDAGKDEDQNVEFERNADSLTTKQIGTKRSKVLRKRKASRNDLEDCGRPNPDDSCDLDQSHEFTQSIDEALKSSRCVDLARETVSKKGDECASWRRTSTNIIIQLVHAYSVTDETAAHAITLLDRFLAANLESSARDSGVWDKPDCYAIACFLLATKFKDVHSPCISDLVRIVRPPRPEELILQCEEEVLSSIGWALHVTTGAALCCHPHPSAPPSSSLSSASPPRAQPSRLSTCALLHPCRLPSAHTYHHCHYHDNDKGKLAASPLGRAREA